SGKRPLENALLKILNRVGGIYEAATMTSVAVSLCLCVAIAYAETPESSTFAPTISNKTAARGPAPEGMVPIPAGKFSMGASTHGHGTDEMPMASNDSEPVHRVRV